MRAVPRLAGLTSIGALLAALLAGVPAASTAEEGVGEDRSARSSGSDRLEVYVGQVRRDQLSALVATGVDRHELELSPVRSSQQEGEDAPVGVELVLSGAQASRLAADGIDLEPKTTGGMTASERADAERADGYEVWQRYSGKGGLRAEVRALAARFPGYTKPVTIGRTLRGKPIDAVKVTAGADKVADGSRPAVLYFSAQHAREWITPEMTTRLLKHVLQQARSKPAMRKMLATNELWFLPVANPDGYDFTFTEGNRLWRKNLRDNDGDGEIAPGDGVDLNRNWPAKWGYDNEGSSPNPASETYRGASPTSEPETRALDRFAGRIDFEFVINYHSAAELLLYGTGWQVATPSPDDVIYEALAGDDERPAVPGYDPDLSAELYTTNGDTDSGITERHGALGFTPEMSTCEVASESDPDDEFEAEDCNSGFEFPDSEELVEAEFRKNIPFAMSVARSAADPDDPRTVTGRSAADFVTDPFETSLGGRQPVAVTAKQALRDHRMRFRIGSGPVRTVPAREWDGGERYGTDNRLYYAEYRGTVTGARPGDRVTVWFAGDKGRGSNARTVTSERFTYTVRSSTGSDVLVIADEDYTGVNPTYPEGTDAPKYDEAHVAAIEDAGYSADVWDVDAQGVPHHLGALSHYDAVLWYLGDNRLTQDPEDEETDTPFGPLEDISVAEKEQYLTIAVRDYLNEGGKLVHAGETAQFEGLVGISDSVGGLYYGLNGDPGAECTVGGEPGTSAGFFEDCLILADDFRQYYLGAFQRTSTSGPTGFEGTGAPFLGTSTTLGGPVVEGDNPLDEAGVFLPTSQVLPPAQFPQFRSRGVGLYEVENGPYAPAEGDRYAGVLHADDAYSRLTRTVDVPTSVSTATLEFQGSWNVEPEYDHLIVEARTAGGDDWTTLPEAGGATSTASPAECEAGGFLFDSHPFLTTYLGEDCSNPEGRWNALTGDSEGYQDLTYDLSAYAGSTVELSITYVSDPASGGVGAFVDDTRVVIDGVEDADGFEGATSDWAPGTPPASSPPQLTQWEIGGNLVENIGATATEDTILLGFGLEQVERSPQRALLVQRSLDSLLR
ncbi:M14 family metallopeptidase [uncultured Nocardioides sp.]|uniref:M14 family metallopeptidase n=1 Tax=uncultured Nocardioides sp. TaxID=198441 RepID=UPI002608A7B2|nr:M14 family metallopeptidase [uncultured Nocardioides sp.]